MIPVATTNSPGRCNGQKQLGAQFLLHLGDLYYQPNDDLNVARTLSSAPLPTYAAIGNHDLPHSFDGELSNWF